MNKATIHILNWKKRKGRWAYCVYGSSETMHAGRFS